MSVSFDLPTRLIAACSPVRFAIAGSLAIAGVVLLGAFSGVRAESGEGGLLEEDKRTALCGERAAIIRTLSDDFAEIPSSSGVTKTGALVELFTSRRGTWTIIATRPDGVSCLMASGDDWRAAPLPFGRHHI